MLSAILLTDMRRHGLSKYRVPERTASESEQKVNQPHAKQHHYYHADYLCEGSRKRELGQYPPNQREDDADNENGDENR